MLELNYIRNERKLRVTGILFQNGKLRLSMEVEVSNWETQRTDPDGMYGDASAITVGWGDFRKFSFVLGA